jgi:hypothetical protein
MKMPCKLGDNGMSNADNKEETKEKWPNPQFTVRLARPVTALENSGAQTTRYSSSNVPGYFAFSEDLQHYQTSASSRSMALRYVVSASSGKYCLYKW